MTSAIVLVLLQNIKVVLLLSGLTFAFVGVGFLITEKIRIDGSSIAEKLFFAFGIGTGLTGYGIFILGSFQLLYPSVLYSLIVVLFLLALWGWRKISLVEVFRSLSLPERLTEKLSLFILSVLLFAAFIMAMAPETGRDALIYHLGVPKLYLAKHGFYFIEGNVFSNLPFHTEMLFLLGLFLGGDIMAKCIAFIVLPFFLLGIHQFALHKMRGNEFPYLSMLSFVAIPSIFKLSTTAYIDIYAAFYAFGAVLSFFNWQENRGRAWLLMFGFFTGLAMSCKYSGLFLPFLGVLGILWTYRSSEDPGPVLKALSMYMLAFIIWGSPFYIKNLILTGNPFYPLLYSFFGGRGLDAELAHYYNTLYRYMGMGRELLDYILLPWNISFNARMDSTRFDGMLGPLFFITLPLLAFIRNIDTRVKIILIYCASYFMFWAFSSQSIRYLSAVLPFLSLLTGYVLTNLNHQRYLKYVLGIAITCCVIYNGYYISNEFMKASPIKVVTGMEDRNTFLDRRISSYPIYQAINKDLPLDANIFLVYMRNLNFLCERKCYSDTMFEHYTLKKILSGSSSPEDVRQKIRERGFTHIAYDEVFVTGSKSLLSAGDIALFKEFQDKFMEQLSSERTFGLYRIL